MPASGKESPLADDDVLVVAQKIVSKAEGRMIALATVQPSARAQELARELDKEAELVEVILGESRNVIRSGGRALIVETHHGFICANAGVDQSNVGSSKSPCCPRMPTARRVEFARDSTGGLASKSASLSATASAGPGVWARWMWRSALPA